jgi:hypothetical protein
MIPRRRFLTAISGAAAVAALPFAWPRSAQSALSGVLAPLPSEIEQGVKTFHLRSRQAALPAADGPLAAWLYADAPPLIRAARRTGAHPFHQRSATRRSASIGVIRVPSVDGVPISRSRSSPRQLCL